VPALRIWIIEEEYELQKNRRSFLVFFPLEVRHLGFSKFAEDVS
jgi:hypothetical protein